MKWLLLAGGALVGLVLMVAVCGAALPVEHHATRRARFRKSADTLYVTLAGPPDWRSDVAGYGALPDQDGRKQWWEQDRHGKKVRFELVEEKPPMRRVVRIADRSLPFGGTWTFEITPLAEGSELRIREDGQVYNVIFRFLARFVFGYTGSIEGFIKDLGARFGEQVRTEA